MTGFDWLLNGLKRELRSREGPGRRRQRRPELPSHRVVVPSLFFFCFFFKYRIAVASPLVAAHLSHRRARRRATTRTAHNRRRFTAVDAPVGVDDSDSIICFFLFVLFASSISAGFAFRPQLLSRLLFRLFFFIYFFGGLESQRKKNDK